MSEDARRIFTVGHSTHPERAFLDLLRGRSIEAIADVRRYPRSRRNPQFSAERLEPTLAEAAIAYVPLGGELGGRRRARALSANTGWRVEGFRGYADHMGTPSFAAGIERLEELAGERRTAVMCAEGDWRRCHRQLIADALAARGWRVLHITPRGEIEQHRLTLFATVEDGGVSYPARP